MEIKTIKLLLIEDDPDDAKFLRLALQSVAGVSFELDRAVNLTEGLARL
jgi:hypothetical protein